MSLSASSHDNKLDLDYNFKVGFSGIAGIIHCAADTRQRRLSHTLKLNKTD